MKAYEVEIKDIEECKELIRHQGAYDSAILGLVAMAIEKKYGEEGYNIIKEAMFEKGKLDAAELMKKGIKFSSFREFGMMFGNSSSGKVNSIIAPKQKMEIRSEKEVVLTHTGCIRCSEWEKLGMDKNMNLKLCDLFFGAFETYVREFFPGMRVSKEKLIAKGDYICRIVFTR